MSPVSPLPSASSVMFCDLAINLHFPLLDALVCRSWYYFRPLPSSLELQICFTTLILALLSTYYEDHVTFFLLSAAFIAPTAPLTLFVFFARTLNIRPM